jgi:hypothetical protein
MTPNLKDRIYFDVKPLPKIIYSEPLPITASEPVSQ